MPTIDVKHTWWHGASIGAAMGLGWVLHDLAFVGATREPYLAFDLGPGSLVAIVVAAAVGFGWAVWTRGTAVLSTGLVVAMLAKPWYRHLAPAAAAAAGPLLLLAAGAGLARWLHRRWNLGVVQAPFAIGLFLSAFRATRKTDLNPVGPHTVAWVAVAVALVLLSSAKLRPRWARQLVAVAALLSLAGVVAYRADANLTLPRADRPPPFLTQGLDRPNLLLITLDTTRAHRLGPYGHERVTTPGLDAFVREQMIVYEQARSSSSWTLPSHATLFTGLYPGEHGASHRLRPGVEGFEAMGRRWAAPLRDDVTTLAERLAGLGYQTAAIAGNSVYLNHAYGLDRGFERYDDRLAARLPARIALAQILGFRIEVGRKFYRVASTITDLALDWFDDRWRRGPYFLFLNYNDAHVPRIPRAPFDRAFEPAAPLDPLVVGADEAWTPLLYDRELLYMDRHLTRLLEELDGRGLLDDTLVVITGDHGEAFGEHGLWMHNKSLYEEVVRVPLYVKSLQRPGPGKVREPISGAEVHDLVLEELGLEPGDRVRRSGALPLPAGVHMIGDWYGSKEFARFGERAFKRAGMPRDYELERDLVAWIQGPLKFIVSSRGDVEIYDVHRDPLESRDLSRSDLAAEPRELAAEWWKRTSPPTRGLEERQ